MDEDRSGATPDPNADAEEEESPTTDRSSDESTSADPTPQGDETSEGETIADERESETDGSSGGAGSAAPAEGTEPSREGRDGADGADEDENENADEVANSSETDARETDPDERSDDTAVGSEGDDARESATDGTRAVDGVAGESTNRDESSAGTAPEDRDEREGRVADRETGDTDGADTAGNGENADEPVDRDETTDTANESVDRDETTENADQQAIADADADEPDSSEAGTETATPMPGVPEPEPEPADVPEDVRKYARFQKMDGAAYERVNEFLRDRTYVTAREWAIARLCSDFRTETGVEMTKIGENLPELVPFMTDTYTPQAVNQARSSFEGKVRKAGATFLYGAMCDFFTAEELDDVMYEATEVAKFLLEVEGVDLTVEEELEAEERISTVMREVREASKELREEELERGG